MTVYLRDWDEINGIANRPNYDGITKDADLKPGDMKFKDLDGDGKITPDDRYRSEVPMNQEMDIWHYRIFAMEKLT